MKPQGRRGSRSDQEDARPASAGTPRAGGTLFTTFSTLVDTLTKPRARGPASDWTIGQRAAVAIGWAVFFWAWITVMLHTAPQTMVVTAILLAAGAAAAGAIDLLWIRHNLNIYRKRGVRRNVSQARHGYGHDFLGRKLVADWSSLLEEDLIVVNFDERRKTFAPHSHELEDEKLASNLNLRTVPTLSEEEAI